MKLFFSSICFFSSLFNVYMYLYMYACSSSSSSSFLLVFFLCVCPLVLQLLLYRSYVNEVSFWTCKLDTCILSAHINRFVLQRMYLQPIQARLLASCPPSSPTSRRMSWEPRPWPEPISSQPSTSWTGSWWSATSPKKSPISECACFQPDYLS